MKPVTVYGMLQCSDATSIPRLFFRFVWAQRGFVLSFTVQVARNTFKQLNRAEIVGLYVIETAKLSNLIHIVGTCARTESYPDDDLQNVWSFMQILWFRFRAGASSENVDPMCLFSVVYHV